MFSNEEKYMNATIYVVQNVIPETNVTGRQIKMIASKYAKHTEKVDAEQIANLIKNLISGKIGNTSEKVAWELFKAHIKLRKISPWDARKNLVTSQKNAKRVLPKFSVVAGDKVTSSVFETFCLAYHEIVDEILK